MDEELGIIKQAKQYVQLHNIVQSIINSNIGWKQKYDLIFNNSVSQIIVDNAFFDFGSWIDPDATEEEDIMAFWNVVKKAYKAAQDISRVQ
jgi:hypothetical protein